MTAPTGILGYILGLVTAALFDLPAGAVIVWLLALSGITVSLATGNNSGRQS
jgi:ABC-type Mn2+/Zn2+ transport system permease subunit